MWMRRAVLITGAIGGALLLPGLVKKRNAKDVTTDTIDVTDIGRVSVRSESGDVSVRTEERDDIHVRVVKHTGSEKAFDWVTLKTTRNGDTLSFVVDRDYKSSMFGRTPRLNLELVVPKSLQLDKVDTGPGSVDIDDVRGPLTVTTGSGSARISGVRGDLVTDVGSGDCTVKNIDGTVTATAGSGDLSARFDTLEGDVSLETGSGDITVGVPNKPDARVSVGTSTGSLSVHGPAVENVSGSEFSRTLGEGSHSLRAEAGSGDVSLVIRSG